MFDTAAIGSLYSYEKRSPVFCRVAVPAPVGGCSRPACRCCCDRVDRVVNAVDHGDSIGARKGFVSHCQSIGRRAMQSFHFDASISVVTCRGEQGEQGLARGVPLHPRGSTRITFDERALAIRLLHANFNPYGGFGSVGTAEATRIEADFTGTDCQLATFSGRMVLTKQ